jgi:uncharacterized protein YcfJ
MTYETPTEPAALPSGMPPRTVARVTENIVLILGAVVILVIFGTMALSVFGKEVNVAIIAMGSVALGFLGNAIQESKNGAANGTN